MWSEKNPGKYTHWKIKKIKMQSHCVCSCVCAVKWFFLASASEYSQWKCYYKRQQVVPAELIKDCSSRQSPTMWLTVLSKGIIISQKLTREWKSYLGRDGDAWNPGEQWEGYGESTDNIFSSTLQNLPFISPLSCATDAAARCAKHGTSHICFKQEFQAFLGDCSSFLMQKFILAQAKGWFGCWTFTVTRQMFNAWAQASKTHPHLSTCFFLHLLMIFLS